MICQGIEMNHVIHNDLNPKMGFVHFVGVCMSAEFYINKYFTKYIPFVK